MKYTGAVKNLYGCIPGGLKPKLHKYFPKESDFADLLVELYNKITENKNIVTIMDGIWGLEGNGPSNGRPINSRIVIGSKSPIALDMFASYYIGYKMDDILTNKYLKTDFKVINADDNKEVPLESIERMNFKKPDTVVLNSIIPFLPFVSTKLTKMIFSFMIPKPRINKRSCVKCGICEKICPVNAIHNLKIDLKKINHSECNYFVICHGNSTTHVDSIAHSVEETVEEVTGEKAWHKDGYQNAIWILLDYADIMVHVFQHEARDFYDIENLWADAVVEEINIEN